MRRAMLGLEGKGSKLQSTEPAVTPVVNGVCS